jgi:hypothetical protein
MATTEKAAPSAFFVRIAAIGELEEARECCDTIKDQLWATEDVDYRDLFRTQEAAKAALSDVLAEWAQERAECFACGDEAPVWSVEIADRFQQPGGLPEDAVWFRLFDEEGTQIDEGIASVCGICLSFR